MLLSERTGCKGIGGSGDQEWGPNQANSKKTKQANWKWDLLRERERDRERTFQF